MGCKRIDSNGHFCIIDFDTEKELRDFMADRKDLFSHVSYAGSMLSGRPTEEGKWRIVF
jgi:hypothetical protein